MLIQAEGGAAQMAERFSMLLTELNGRILAHDRDGAIALALDSVRSRRLTVPELYDALSQLLVKVGESWQSGETPVWQEHFATAVVRTVVEACHPLVAVAAKKPNGRSVILATPPEEYHDLGLRMTADLFELAGWDVHLLGASLPVAELSAAVDALDADAVVLSASTHFHRIGLKAYVAQLRSAHPALRVWVGGAAFATGAEDWAENMLLDSAAIPSE
jgi:methanogenic corrinoid protein MtbC1